MQKYNTATTGLTQGINITPPTTTTTQPTYFTQARIRRRKHITIPIRRISTVSSNLQNQLCSILQRNRAQQAQAKTCKKQGSDGVFPKVPDQHKVGQPLIPNGLGVLYVLFTTVYLFLLYFLKIAAGASVPTSAPFTLLSCILFGGFMGLLDDWMDLNGAIKHSCP